MVVRWVFFQSPYGSPVSIVSSKNSTLFSASTTITDRVLQSICVLVHEKRATISGMEISYRLPYPASGIWTHTELKRSPHFGARRYSSSSGQCLRKENENAWMNYILWSRNYHFIWFTLPDPSTIPSDCWQVHLCWDLGSRYLQISFDHIWLFPKWFVVDYCQMPAHDPMAIRVVVHPHYYNEILWRACLCKIFDKISPFKIQYTMNHSPNLDSH